MALFIVFERNVDAPALGLVPADRLVDAEAMGAAMYNRDVIAYHASQMPKEAATLAALDVRSDGLEQRQVRAEGAPYA